MLLSVSTSAPATSRPRPRRCPWRLAAPAGFGKGMHGSSCRERRQRWRGNRSRPWRHRRPSRRHAKTPDPSRTGDDGVQIVYDAAAAPGAPAAAGTSRRRLQCCRRRPARRPAPVRMSCHDAWGCISRAAHVQQAPGHAAWVGAFKSRFCSAVERQKARS